MVKKETTKQTQEKEIPSSRMAGNMITNEEIKDICHRNDLTRGEVYNIRTEYASMCLMSEQWVQEQKLNGGQQQTHGGLETKRNGMQSTRNENSTVSKQDGINVEYYAKYSRFLSGSLPHISKRILVAEGKNYINN